MNFNVNFIVLLSKYIVHPLVKIKKYIDNIKMHGTTMKTEYLYSEAIFKDRLAKAH